MWRTATIYHKSLDYFIYLLFIYKWYRSFYTLHVMHLYKNVIWPAPSNDDAGNKSFDTTWRHPIFYADISLVWVLFLFLVTSI